LRLYNDDKHGTSSGEEYLFHFSRVLIYLI